MQSLGVDIGGTKIAAAIIDKNGDISYRKEVKTCVESAEKLFDQLLKLINDVLLDSEMRLNDIDGIGIGVPGKVDQSAGIAIVQNNIPWKNFPIVERLSSFFPNTKIKIDNDVKVASIAEKKHIGNKAKHCFSYLTISTGIASTSMIGEEIIRGEGFAGEIGFFPVYNIFQDKYQTVEELASGPGIERLGKLLYDSQTITSKEVFELYKKNDIRATKIIKECAKVTAVVLYAHITILNPSHIVIGGSVATNNPCYINFIKQYLKDLLVTEQIPILDNISISELGSNNGLIGAGYLVMN